MRFGRFDDARREYVITAPSTPLPWINYLGSEDLIGLISNTGGGYTFYKDARLRRLTRYRHNNAPLDVGARFLYLRDDAPNPANPRFWSPSWIPSRVPLDDYECRHGMGYTTIKSACGGIQAETRYLIPLGENVEIWDLALRNQRSAPADISLFAAVEFCLWDALDDASNFQRNYSVGEVEVPGPESSGIDAGLIIHKTEYRERRNHIAYFACSAPTAGFDTDRQAFLGTGRGWDAPWAVETGKLGNSRAHGWQPIGAHHVRVHLKAGETRRVIFLLGYHENADEAKFDPADSSLVNRFTLRPVVARGLDPQRVDAAFAELREHWDRLLGKFVVRTPDEHTNRMANIWNAYQMMVTFLVSRSASYFESGIGRGIGFRDSNQDLLGFVHLVPERTRQRILDLAATQLPDGGAYHQYQPLTKRGNDNVGSNFNDDPLWLVLAAVAYLKETGDWGILDAPVPYDNRPGTETPMMEHLQRCIQYTRDRLGPHGLPLIGRADWNDCLNLNTFSNTPGESFQTTTNKEGKIAESVFIAGMFVLACKEMAELTKHLSPAGRVSSTFTPEALTESARDMEAAIWAAGWDGDWFRRAYDDFGHVLGAKDNTEGRIFIEPQGMCVMAGLGLEDGRARRALDAVAANLATPHGLMLVQPAFTRYQLHLGEITSYPPGYKENAGIFCHANPWIMIAHAMLGDGDGAHDYYLRINPSAREHLSDLHRCEPYVYAQMIAGRDAPAHGEAKNSWLTGSAAWSYVALTQWILGIRPTYDGLRIAPVMPSAWSGFEAVREFRGVRYAIRVRREGPGNAVSLEVDGKVVNGGLVPLPPAGTERVSVLATVR